MTVARCAFERLDGNAVFLSRRTRGVLLSENSFAWLGMNAMATWGDTDEFDATAGNQPRGTRVVGNLVREVGIYEKQSSGWGQAKACLTELRGNIFFNMPRAAINFNDGTPLRDAGRPHTLPTDFAEGVAECRRLQVSAAGTW